MGYREISEILKEEINDGRYAASGRLPQQKELSERFKVSRVTIQKALNLLKEQGLILAGQGKGTFLSFQAEQRNMPVEEYRGMKTESHGSVDSRIVSFEVRFGQDEELERLSLPEEAVVYDIIRLRLLNDEPYALEYTIMPVQVIPGITKEVLNHSVYEHIRHTLKLSIGKAERHIHADKPDAFDQKYLNCRKDDPVLEVEQVVYLADGRPFEYSQTRFFFFFSGFAYESNPQGG